MTNVIIEAQISTEQLMQAVERLPVAELNQLADRVLILRARTRAPVLPVEETTLLQRINTPIPVAVHQRAAMLVERREQEVITSAELAELIALTEQIEAADVQRLEALTQLADVRGVTLRTLMRDLGITGPQYG